jgi:hypothetical protein
MRLQKELISMKPQEAVSTISNDTAQEIKIAPIKEESTFKEKMKAINAITQRMASTVAIITTLWAGMHGKEPDKKVILAQETQKAGMSETNPHLKTMENQRERLKPTPAPIIEGIKNVETDNNLKYEPVPLKEAAEKTG